MLRPVILPTDPTQGQIGRFLIACMALGFVSLIAAGIAAVWANGQIEEHAGWVSHSYQVEVAIADARIRIEQAETARRGYLLTDDHAYETTYQEALTGLGPSLDRLATLTSDNPRQGARIATLRAILAALQHQRDATISLMHGARRDAALAAFNAETGARRLAAIRATFGDMRTDEHGLLRQRDAKLHASTTTFYLILTLAGVLLVFVAIASLLTVLRYTRDLATSRDRLSKLNETLEDQVAERTADLSRANEEIQRFAYIVSHDLRSPLVNVMGFTAELEAATGVIAELIDRAEATAPDIVTEEARDAARADLPEAIGFIRTSTQKMDRLINAILKLSREGRRILTPESIDLPGLLDTIGASLQHRIDEEGVELTVARPMPAIVTDRLAMEQILSNLIENAIKYRQPGRIPKIAVRARRDGPRVVLEIEDNGRGIAASDHARIFDLFRRSGNQDRPGEGIGLAHVRALAYRLGGTVTVESEFGHGATFRLTLPPSLSDAQDA
jgi:signal transduction histidine kinase